MKLLVIGGGGREHALAWKLAQSPRVSKVFVAPGNAGTALEDGVENVDIADHGKLVEFARKEQIALTVAQANSCEYCLSAHSAIGKMVGLKPEEILASREAHAQDAKRNAGLRFAQTLVVQRGEVSDQTLADVKAAGYNDGDLTEIVANVAINIFTNYFNHLARTDVDFPRVPVALTSHQTI